MIIRFCRAAIVLKPSLIHLIDHAAVLLGMFLQGRNLSSKDKGCEKSIPRMIDIIMGIMIGMKNDSAAALQTLRLHSNYLYG